MDHVVLLPHVGSASVHTRNAMGQLVVDNLVSWFAGKGPLTPVAETPMDRPRRLRLCAVAACAALVDRGASRRRRDVRRRSPGAWDLSLRRRQPELPASCFASTSRPRRPRRLRFPAGCRRALPVLNGMGGWMAPSADRLRLLEPRARPR